MDQLATQNQNNQAEISQNFELSPEINQPVPEASIANQNLTQTANQMANQGINLAKGDNLSPSPNPTVGTKLMPKNQKTQSDIFGKSELLDSAAILSQILGLKVGNRVADLGAGGGLFTMQAARIVSDQGEVYAVDIMKTALSDIDSKSRMAGLYNIKTIWSNIEILGATKIPEASLDYVLLVNVLFQSQKHIDILNEAKRLLKSPGKILVVDWDEKNASFSPQASMKVDQNKLIKDAEALGLRLEQQFKAGQYHFGMVFIK